MLIVGFAVGDRLFFDEAGAETPQCSVTQTLHTIDYQDLYLSKHPFIIRTHRIHQLRSPNGTLLGQTSKDYRSWLILCFFGQQNRRIVFERMISIKSIKYIQALKTQKMIREEAQKEDFFDNLLTSIKTQFRPEEYQYLISFVIPRKHQSKERKRPQIQSINSFFNLDSKQNMFATFSGRSSAKTYKQIKSFKKVLTECSQELPQEVQNMIKGNETQKGKKRARFAPKLCQNEQKTARDVSKNMKKMCRIKFKQISQADRGISDLKSYSSFKLSKRSKKVLQQKLFSQQKVKQNYNECFLSDVMKSQTNQQTIKRMESTDFDETPLMRKTHHPQNQFWQRQKEQERKFKHLTSMMFQKSANTSRNGLRIYTRKF